MAAGGKGTKFFEATVVAVLRNPSCRQIGLWRRGVLENLFWSLGVTTTSGAIATTRQCLFRCGLFFFLLFFFFFFCYVHHYCLDLF
jgi:hypothetical protein